MEEPPKKIYVEQDLLQEVWYQIDRSLQKRWPDIFIHDDLMKLKESIYKGMEEYEEERRSRRLFVKAVKRVESKEAENKKELEEMKKKIQEICDWKRSLPPIFRSSTPLTGSSVKSR